MFNQHLHYDSNSKPAMQRRWSGDNLRRKLIAQKHLQHGAIHPFQLSKLSFWHILCLHCANKELSVQAVSNVLKLRLLLPGIWKKFLPTIPAHTCVQGNITSSCVFSYVSYANVVSKMEVETVETYKYLIWDIHQSTNHMIRLPSLLQLSHRFAWNPVIQKHRETIYRFTVKITMLRLVLPDLTRRLFQSLANREQIFFFMAQSDHVKFQQNDWNDWSWYSEATMDTWKRLWMLVAEQGSRSHSIFVVQPCESTRSTCISFVAIKKHGWKLSNSKGRLD